MSVNNCNCKRVLVMPKISNNTKAIVFIRTATSGGGSDVDLKNYYTKKQTDELLSDKLSTSELDSAIDQALLKAKESGEFKGEKGEQGIQGERGEKGEQGERGLQGEQGIQGEKGEQGERGEDGYTPIKGTDYFTDADKQELIAELTPTIESMLNEQIEELEYGTY